MKITAIAHSNLAFVKYWGKHDPHQNIPQNNSISMNLSGAKTTTSVEISELGRDLVFLSGEQIDSESGFGARIIAHVEMIRSLSGSGSRVIVRTENSFPESVGLAASASGFAALSLACVRFFGLDLDERELSIIARRGSGSACRSIPSGFVEWHAGGSDSNSYSVQLAPPDHWDLVDLAVAVSSKKKAVSSSRGHALAETSPFWTARMESVPDTLRKIREAIISRDFRIFGEELEKEALSFHGVALTSSYSDNLGWKSGIYYWEEDTIMLMKAVQALRAEGLAVYFTLDAGPTVHLMCESQHLDELRARVVELQGPRNWSLFVNQPAEGAYVLEGSG